ncbi:hypothetical protein FM21_04560 [Streptomyces mutabilis]|uniref:ABC transporter domain-containing protein n=1 Tax=Streptomyces mutabilis TaxID=67332 RepID=A0A086N2Q2_9ACTN|nr:hypothetical protein FM21_04560 [Streptomyces mutabilis]
MYPCGCVPAVRRAPRRDAARPRLRPADLDRPVGDLSTGQRRRLEPARLVAEPHDLLLLDEPTNRLSPAPMEDLRAALADHAGTLVVVSHDRRLRASFDGPVTEPASVG